MQNLKPQRDKASPKPEEIDSVLGVSSFSYVHWFAALCFFIFGFIYLNLLKSHYLFLSNFFFGLCVLTNRYVFGRWVSPFLQLQIFLFMVYIGLVNVVSHIGNVQTPMIFWGLTVSLASAFYCGRKCTLLWGFLGLVFLPLSEIVKFKVTPFSVINLNDQQWLILSVATYIGILSFISFSFFVFQSKLSETLVQLNDRKTELENLVKVICHDMTSPLTAIRIRAELLTDAQNKLFSSADTSLADTFPIETKPIIEQAQKNSKNLLALTERVSALISQIRDYSKSWLVTYEESKSICDLTFCLRESVSCMQHLLHEKRVTLQLSQIPPHSIWVHFDSKNLTYQVLNNILSNAVKFSRADSIIKIEILESKETSSVEMKIVDHGVGIPSFILFKLGTPSCAYSRPGTNGEIGSGYGSAIVKAYTQAFGAEVTYQSTIDAESGTTVTLKFRSVENLSLFKKQSLSEEAFQQMLMD